MNNFGVGLGIIAVSVIAGAIVLDHTLKDSDGPVAQSKTSRPATVQTTAAQPAEAPAVAADNSAGAMPDTRIAMEQPSARPTPAPSAKPVESVKVTKAPPKTVASLKAPSDSNGDSSVRSTDSAPTILAEAPSSAPMPSANVAPASPVAPAAPAAPAAANVPSTPED